MFAESTLTTMIPASDIERAKNFYINKLGLKPIEGEFGNLRFKAGEATFIVYPSEFAGTNKATAAMFEVADVEACVNALKGDGVEFQEFSFEDMVMENSILTAPNGFKGAWFFDSEGNILGLGEEV